MSAGDPTTDSPAAGPKRFHTTHWSLVLAAGHDASPAARQALAQLCEIYWYPLYAYVRRLGHQPAEALKGFLGGGASNLPYAQIAEQLDSTAGAVKVAVHRLRTFFRSVSCSTNC